MKGYEKAREYNNCVTYGRVAKKFSKGDFIPIELEERIDILEKSILNKVFKGELGTQNSSDEPAIELLKEIL